MEEGKVTHYKSLESALKDVPTATELHIDFSKGAKLTDDVGKLKTLAELHLRSCPPDLVLPISLADLPNLKKLTLTGANDQLTVPALVRDLAIEHLSVWNCEVAQLTPLRRLRSLTSTRYKGESGPHLTALANALPDLAELELAGGESKASAMPSDVAKLTKLEALTLNATNFNAFPAEFSRLVNLKKLELRESALHAIPNEVCDLPNLRSLEIGMQVNGLPAEMTKLTRLRELDLSDALNKGASLGNSWDDDQIPKLKPLPKVLSELTWLTHLKLSSCGVWDIEPLGPLVNLIALTLSWASIESCNALAGMTRLETLVVNECGKLADFSALTSMPKLRTLKMSSTKPRSLEFLTKLPALRELDISSVKSKDFSPIYTLNLEELEADEGVKARWEKRAELSELPSIDDVKKRLKSADVALVDAGLRDLVKIVDAMSSDETNGLMTVFGDEDEGDETAVLKRGPLDSALKKNKDELSSETLTAVFGAALRKIGDNFDAALIVVAELVEREDAIAQEAAVQSFIQAAENYDSGHRYDENTVHDQLIEKYFPKFEAAPLATLLAWCRNGHLDSETGDRMDALFLPAFTRVKDDSTVNALIVKLGAYVKEQLQYGHDKSIAALLEKTEKATPEKFKKAFEVFREQQAAAVSAAKQRAKIVDDVESGEPRRIEAAIERVDTLSAKEWESINHKFWQHLRTKGVSWEARRKLLDFFFARDDARGVESAIRSLATEDAERLRKELDATAIPKDAIAKGLRNALDVALEIAHEREIDPKFLENVRVWAFELDGISPEAAKGDEAAKMLVWACTQHVVAVFDAGLAMLETISGSADFTVRDTSYGGTIGNTLAGYVGQAVKSEPELMLRLARLLHKLIVTDQTRERMLAQLFGLAVVHEDHEAIAALTKLLPNEISNDVLAYNLSCAAARSNDREGVLKYTRRSLQLGKSPTQFRADADFAAFLDDPELAGILDASL